MNKKQKIECRLISVNILCGKCGVKNEYAYGHYPSELDLTGNSQEPEEDAYYGSRSWIDISCKCKSCGDLINISEDC